MWNAIKSFFGVADESSHDNNGNNNNNNNDNSSLNSPQTTADQIREATDGLNKLRLELEQVEKAIKDSKALVAKAEGQQEMFVTTLACLEMECHDEFLHPEWNNNNNGNSDREAENAVRSDKSNDNDDDQQQQVEQQQQQRKKKQQLASQQQRATLVQAIELLRHTYLPQIEEQKDTLDLNAFRLTLRLQKLRAEEADSRRRVQALQAEAHERWGKYTTTQQQQSENNDDRSETIRVVTHDDRETSNTDQQQIISGGASFSPLTANDFVPPPPAPDVVVKK